MPNNDIAYNPADGLLYASVATSGGSVPGNSVVGLDPTTGNVIRQIWVGSNPDKLAISTDGTQLFVGLDGAGAVAQVDLTQGKVVNQFSLGGGAGVYDPPYTALYLAAVPGLPNSVAVAVAGSFTGGAGVTIFDSGVARTNSSSGVSYGPLSFGTSASTLYMAGSSIEQLTVRCNWHLRRYNSLQQLRSAEYHPIRQRAALSFHGRRAQRLYRRTAGHLLQHRTYAGKRTGGFRLDTGKSLHRRLVFLSEQCGAGLR